MAMLHILEGPDAGSHYEFEDGRVLVGRGEECQVRLNQGSISRQHAAFSQINGVWQIEDLNSQNGVFVEDEQVSRAALRGDCVVRFGTINARFELGATPVAAAAPPAEEQVAPPAVEQAAPPAVEQAAPPAVEQVAPPAERVVAPPPAAAAEPPRAAALRSAVSAEMSAEGIKELGQATQLILTEFGRVIIGQKQVAEELLIAIAAGGHCLMIGLPGLAKTLMVSTLAQVLNLQFKRVQFTPDLMPSDIIGTDVLDVEEGSGRKSFRFIKGPIFTNMLLADEINRTPPKTQAALLEAMQEKQVTASNQQFKLPPPFFVLATQNPLEQEGTYPLPEAQLDRFMFNILVDYPAAEEEEAIVMATTSSRKVQLQQVLDAADLVRLQGIVRDLPVSPHVVKYATRLVRMTRPKDAEAPDFIREHVHCGAGPRAAQCLILGAKARAILQGRVNVSCSDIKSLALPVLRHRIFTNFTADSEGITPDDLVQKLVAAAPEPSAKDYQG